MMLEKDSFTQWLESNAKLAYKDNKAKKKDIDFLHDYYVYALCEKKNNKDLIPFYFGKGKKSRMWDHLHNKNEELKVIEEEYKDDKSELEGAKYTVDAKHKKIEELLKDNRIEMIIIKSGLSNHEALMCESALINIFRMEHLKLNDGEELTNKINGHGSLVEKTAGVETAAYPVDVFVKKYCKEIVFEQNNNLFEIKESDFVSKKDFNGKIILLQNINKTYMDCAGLHDEEQKKAIRECVRGFWRQIKTVGEDKRSIIPDYVFAIFQSRIVGVYKVNKDKRNFRGTDCYRILDIWHDKYPYYKNIVKDKIIAEQIYKEIIKNEEDFKLFKKNYLSSEKKKNLYVELSPETQEEIKNEIYDIKNASNDNERCKKLKNWIERKFLVLDEAEEFNRYLDFRLTKEGGESIFDKQQLNKFIKNGAFEQNVKKDKNI